MFGRRLSKSEFGLGLSFLPIFVFSLQSGCSSFLDSLEVTKVYLFIVNSDISDVSIVLFVEKYSSIPSFVVTESNMIPHVDRLVDNP
jgi:hypothetical protein